MTLEEAKQELVKRYKYLYENAFLILNPYEKEVEKELPKYMNKSFSFDEISSLFEEFLLSDKNMEDTILYKMVENKRNDKEYLEQVKRDFTLLKEDIKNKEYFKNNFSIWKILNMTGEFIEEQSGNSKNKEDKLKVIDEYFRIARYKNDGNICTSGRRLNLYDCDSLLIPIPKSETSKNKKYLGIKKNPFITAIANAPRYGNNWSIFTESEKQKIYLGYHDELPWDLKIDCVDDENKPLNQEEKLSRPSNTSSCGKSFLVKEEEIFINPSATQNRYYQICPYCGWIVNIPSETLSDGIKQRIENRCAKDKMLFRKMMLYSELFSLDKNSTEEQKKLLKNNVKKY